MGIAGFFLWLKQWYGSCVDDIPQEVVDAALRGEACTADVGSSFRYDNFYIDMNGLIHPCCHDTQPLPEPETETEMFERMFHQLDLLVKVVRPRRCLVLCIDGVAPRSKMNQQRSRRFRAADERLESDAIAAKCAKTLIEKHGLPPPRLRQRWDHNVITPSTDFMERVGLALEWFVMKKLNEDEAWRALAVIFSDAHVPGEGEHKIMHYIRGLRSQPGYNPDTTHVIHGMDADLVCLGLSTHESYVSILRNQLTETFQPDHNRFCYFNLHTFRARLMEDFGNIADMQFERVVDDFIFLCFFVGNDFLPHVPLISIKTKGIELMLDHYVRRFDSHGYLTKGGEVDFARLHLFLSNFVQDKMPELRTAYQGVAYAKQRAKRQVGQRVSQLEAQLQGVLDTAKCGAEADADDETKKSEAVQKASDTALTLMSSIVKERVRLVADQQPLSFSYLDEDYREAYYTTKFGWSSPTSEDASRADFDAKVQRCCAEYLRGMQWVMRYYTKGCPSWEWYYPYHYAPLLQDLAAYTGPVDVHMRLSAPLHPVEQLLAVLPRLSVDALPPELHAAVRDPGSVLAPFYPDKVDVDFSEANFAYQGVLRIPFIQSQALRRACRSLVTLEADVGTTLLFCHRSNRLCRQLDQLLQNGDDAGTDQADARLVSIPAEVACKTPIAGRVGVYRCAWPRLARLDCPDPEIATKTSYGGCIRHNAVREYRYELDTQAEYKQEILERRHASIRHKRDATAKDGLPSPEECNYEKDAEKKTRTKKGCVRDASQPADEADVSHGEDGAADRGRASRATRQDKKIATRADSARSRKPAAKKGVKRTRSSAAVSLATKADGEASTQPAGDATQHAKKRVRRLQ